MVPEGPVVYGNGGNFDDPHPFSGENLLLEALRCLWPSSPLWALPPSLCLALQELINIAKRPKQQGLNIHLEAGLNNDMEKVRERRRCPLLG